MTTVSHAEPVAEPWWSRLGVPSLAGNGRLVSATAIDSVGTGLILAFTVVYFVRTTAVSLAAIGAALTVARLCAVPTAVVIGPLIDRFTARRTAITGNLISAVGYVGFLFAHAAWSIAVVAFLVQIGHTAYWTSNAALVATASPTDRRARWFGFLYAVRNAGMGLGSALGAFALAIGGVTGLHAIALANAASFVIAALLLGLWRPEVRRDGITGTADERPDPAARPAKGRYSTVLRDRDYAVLIGVNVTLVFAQMLIKVLLAVYIVSALHKGAWLAGALIVLSTVQISLTQTVIHRRIERYRATRAIAGAAVLNATAFALFALLYVSPDAVVAAGLFVAMVVFTFGEIIGFPIIDNLSVTLAPEPVRGRYLAVFQLSWTLGEIAAPVVLTSLLAAGATLPMIFLLVLSLAAVPLLLILERTAASRVAPSIPAAR